MIMAMLMLIPRAEKRQEAIQTRVSVRLRAFIPSIRHGALTGGEQGYVAVNWTV
jgi:hypothetical protein